MPYRTRMWADAKRDGRSAEYRWCRLQKFRNSTFLVPRCKVWLTPAAGVPCSNAGIGRKLNSAADKIPSGGKIPRKCIYSVSAQERPNTVQSLVGLRWATCCSNEAKTRNSLKFAGCSKLRNRSQPLVGRRSTMLADIVKVKFHYAIQVADLVVDLLARASSW